MRIYVQASQYRCQLITPTVRTVATDTGLDGNEQIVEEDDPDDEWPQIILQQMAPSKWHIYSRTIDHKKNPNTGGSETLAKFSLKLKEE